MPLFLGVIILSLIEGFTEFLPISSTGHLILFSSFFRIESTEFWKSFEIAIQLGALLSVIVLYWRKLAFDRLLLLKVLVSFIPTAVIGWSFYKLIKGYLMENVQVVLWALLIGGILIILFEISRLSRKYAFNGNRELTWSQAFLVGVCQSLAVIPGVSRSAVTILGGLLLGVDRKAIVEFSFLLAIPTIASAAAYDFIKSSVNFTPNEFGLLMLGFALSFLTAILAVRFLLSFIQTRNFIPFGVYRILLALIFWFVLIR